MEKFILKNGEEVKMGDKLIKQGVVNTLFGKEFTIQEVIVNEKTLPELLKAGVLTPAGCAHGTDCHCKPCAKNEVPMDMNFYIERIAARLGWKPEKVYNYLNSVDSILPVAAFSIILKEIAMRFDDGMKSRPVLAFRIPEHGLAPGKWRCSVCFPCRYRRTQLP